MEDDSLDSLITSLPEGLSTQPGDVSGNGNASQAIQRPKLRKIKRPKIRPMSDTPQAPAKIMPQEAQPTGETVSQPDSDLSNFINSVGTEQDIATPDSNILAEDAREELKQSTSIIKAVETQNIANNDIANQYILDALPPELDYITDDDAEETFDDSSAYVKKNLMFIAAGICLFVGLFIGKALFSSQTIEKHGLEGVVTNPDVPAGRPRCGLTDKSQACVFYVMNWYKQELNGRDFYKLAAQLTGREEYMIETDNLRYATVKIKPGHFAQLNIPAM